MSDRERRFTIDNPFESIARFESLERVRINTLAVVQAVMAPIHWLFAALLCVQAHFAASYFVPLDEEAQAEFGGLLAWLWPWSGGDSGLLGQVTVDAGIPFAGIILAATAGTCFLLAALAVVDLWVPVGWWRVLAGGGAVLSFVLMAGFFGATKVAPMALDLVVVWIAITDPLESSP